jgi:protocatechuate 3,4-dioxygenase beta subunit
MPGTLPRFQPRPVAGRRAACAALVALPAVWRAAIAQPALRPTPAQTEGPFYPVAPPADADHDLLRNGSRAAYGRGEAAWVGGTLTDLGGRALAGAEVEIWQCDADGHYHHPGDGGRADPGFQGFGRVRTGADGLWRFRTLRPVPYGGRTPHIHLKVRLGRRELLTTQLYVEGDPRNASDFLWNRLPPADRALLTVPFRRAGDQLAAQLALVVAA